MTVSYTAEVATCRYFGCFLKLLLRWKASVYKLIWTDLSLFLILYYSLSAVYRFFLDDSQKLMFEKVVVFFREHTSQSSLSFVLGFYVSIVMTRWWSQYMSIPWPDSIAVFVSATIHGNDERGRLMRRTIVRYVCVCLTLVLANVSPRVKRRFPTLEYYVDAGLLLENELAIFQSLNSKFPKPSKHWLPIVWASSIVTRARKEGRIRDDFAVKTLIDELNKFRGSCGVLVQYDTISIPLVYTQVVTIATYTYFLTSVIGQQHIQQHPTHQSGTLGHTTEVDFYFPIFSTLEIFFYMGWLKVAETLINPFGEDDDDFEVNWIVDRNLQVSYLIVDEMHHEHPELIRDQYWDEVFPTELPYTAATEVLREEHPEPSTAGIQPTAAEQEFQHSNAQINRDGPDQYGQSKYVDDDAVSGIHFVAGKVSRSNSRVSNRDGPSMVAGSTASNIGGSLTRINSVTNVLKRLFSKEDKTDGAAGSVKTPGKIPNSSSSASLKYTAGAGGSMRIGVIEEVDEQMTITSVKIDKPPPHVADIFPIHHGHGHHHQGPPQASAPMNVPGGGNPMMRNGDIITLSSSAPVSNLPGSSGESAASSRYRPQMSAPGYDCFPRSQYNRDDNVSTRSMSSNEDTSCEDEFSKLKKEREKERREKAIRKLSRSASNRGAGEGSSAQDVDVEDLLLTEISRGSS